jgi:hypothetical protein
MTGYAFDSSLHMDLVIHLDVGGRNHHVMRRVGDLGGHLLISSLWKYGFVSNVTGLTGPPRNPFFGRFAQNVASQTGLFGRQEVGPTVFTRGCGVVTIRAPKPCFFYMKFVIEVQRNVLIGKNDRGREVASIGCRLLCLNLVGPVLAKSPYGASQQDEPCDPHEKT